MLDISPLATDCKPASHDRSESGDVAELPNGLDPVRHRIICEHFFGFRPVGDVGRATTAVTSDQDCEVFACPT